MDGWIVAAYQAAIRDGVDPVSFWGLTPYQTRLTMQGLRDGRTTLAWQIAALSRQKKLSNLEQLLCKKKPKTGADLMEALKGLKNG